MRSSTSASCSGYPAGIYMLKVNNRNTRTWREICSKLTIKMVSLFWYLYG